MLSCSTQLPGQRGALVQSCLDDVAACDLYIGILGLRYGYVHGKPFRNSKKLSITELEYRHAGDKDLPRHVFLKDESRIPYTLTDAKTKEHSPERIEAFRLMARTDQRAAFFKDLPDLREGVLKAFSDFEKKPFRAVTSSVCMSTGAPFSSNCTVRSVGLAVSIVR